MRISNFYSLLCKIPHVTKVMFFSETAKCYITVLLTINNCKINYSHPYNLKNLGKV